MQVAELSVPEPKQVMDRPSHAIPGSSVATRVVSYLFCARHHWKHETSYKSYNYDTTK